MQGTFLEETMFRTTGGLLILTLKTTAEFPDSPAVLYKSMQRFSEQLTSSLWRTLLDESSQEWTAWHTGRFLHASYFIPIIHPFLPLCLLANRPELIEPGCVSCNHLQIHWRIGDQPYTSTIQAAGEYGEDRLLPQLGTAVAAVPSVKSQCHMAQRKLALSIHWRSVLWFWWKYDMLKSNEIE